MSKTIRVNQLSIIKDYIAYVKEITGTEITESQAVDSLIQLGFNKIMSK